MKALTLSRPLSEHAPSEQRLVDGAYTAPAPRTPTAALAGNRQRLVLAGALCVGASLLTSGCSSVGAASGAAAGVASGLVT